MTQELGPIQTKLRTNLESINARISGTCRACGRSPNDVRLVAVTKYARWEWVQALAKIHSTFGESRPQQLAERQPQLPRIQWHQIGQIQRNKARLAVQHASVIHSVDSLKLLKRLCLLAEQSDRPVEILLQVNISGERSKSGFDPGVITDSWETIARTAGTHAKLTGLMTMAPIGKISEDARPVFKRLSQLRQQINERDTSPELTELSMGMSSDFDVAIEEGATMIRIGSALFDGLETNEH
ncbi:MAG: YggS family pyridoxal phosphate-dependent enzyme [Fuerstiella sp.]|nr:YggS family pyridoxal phosphate-dependent enzyme [Fuerstiella sp.]